MSLAFLRTPTPTASMTVSSLFLPSLPARRSSFLPHRELQAAKAFCELSDESYLFAQTWMALNCTCDQRLWGINIHGRTHRGCRWNFPFSQHCVGSSHTRRADMCEFISLNAKGNFKGGDGNLALWIWKGWVSNLVKLCLLCIFSLCFFDHLNTPPALCVCVFFLTFLFSFQSWMPVELLSSKKVKEMMT